MSAIDRCHDCDARLATEADAIEAEKRGDGGDASICWRAWYGDTCMRDSIDWRAETLRLRIDLAYHKGLEEAALQTRGEIEALGEKHDALVRAIRASHEALCVPSYSERKLHGPGCPFAEMSPEDARAVEASRA